MLLDGEGSGLAGGTAGYDSVGAVRDLELEELLEHFIVNGAVMVHRSYQSNAGTGKNMLVHSFLRSKNQSM